MIVTTDAADSKCGNAIFNATPYHADTVSDPWLAFFTDGRSIMPSLKMKSHQVMPIYKTIIKTHDI
jgi:hypothetical protein